MATEKSRLLEVSGEGIYGNGTAYCGATVNVTPTADRCVKGGALFPSWWSWRGDVRQRLKRAYHIRSLVAVKSVESFLVEREARPEGQRLAESLGFIDLVGYGVGCTVGAGIYSLIGIGTQIAGEQLE